MFRLVGLGLVSALFFSSTFVLNRAMSLEGGHWIWTASLRFGYMLIFLCLLMSVRYTPRSLITIVTVFKQYWKFWILTGSIGFGMFYAPLCFASMHAPGWIIASTWETNILATPLVLFFFGKKVPGKALWLSSIIFVGAILVNAEQGGTVSSWQIFLGVAPVLLAAVSYQVGNQLIGEAKVRGHKLIPHIHHPIMTIAPARVLLMTIGSLPFWLVALALINPPAPSAGQHIKTALVALLSGVIATSVFFKARHSTENPYEIVAVDAAKSGEVAFSLLGEILFLSGSLPHLSGTVGLLMIIGGVALYSWEQVAPKTARQPDDVK